MIEFRLYSASFLIESMVKKSLGHEIFISEKTAALCRTPGVAAVNYNSTIDRPAVTAIYWWKAALANKGHCKGESLYPNKIN